jgi:TonB family protein
MGIKRFLILPAFMLLTGLALAQTDQPAKPDQVAKPEPTPQAEQQAKPDEAAKPDQTPQTEQTPKPASERLSSSFAEGLKIKDVTPIYPGVARQQRLQGDVLLQALIDTKGNIVKIKVVQGDPILVAAAVDAVKKWKYRPYIFKGEPVTVETTIRIQFRM